MRRAFACLTIAPARAAELTNAVSPSRRITRRDPRSGFRSDQPSRRRQEMSIAIPLFKKASIALVGLAIFALSESAHAGVRCIADRDDHVPLPPYSYQFCYNHAFYSVWTGNGDLGIEVSGVDVNTAYSMAYNDALNFCVYLDGYTMGCYVRSCEIFLEPSSQVIPGC